MTRARPWITIAGAGLIAVGAVSACKKSAPATEAPGSAGGDAAPYDGEADGATAEPERAAEPSLPELTEALDRLGDELGDLADAGAGGGATPQADDEGRCARICEIATATCDLQTQICELADAHADEARYADACERASAQCSAATDACTGCRG